MATSRKTSSAGSRDSSAGIETGAGALTHRRGTQKERQRMIDNTKHLVHPDSTHQGRFSLGRFSLHGKPEFEEGVAWNGEGEMVSGGTYKVEGLDDEGHLPSATQELYFDLIFVAAVVNLAEYMKANSNYKKDETWLAIGESFLAFCVLWLTWIHLTFFLNRFQVPVAGMFWEFLYMLSTLGVCVEMFRAENANIGLQHYGFFVALACNRGLLILAYHKIWLDIPQARSHIHWYSIGVGSAWCLYFIGIFVDDVDARVALLIVALILEINAYPISWVGPNMEKKLPIDVRHLGERMEEWTILVLGESIVSLVVVPENASHGIELYWNELFGFAIVYLLLQYQVFTQPTHLTDDFDEHALDLSHTRAYLYTICALPITFGLYLAGSGFKILMYYGFDDEYGGAKYTQNQALLLTAGLAMYMAFSLVRQFTHEYGHEVFGWSNGRAILSTVQIAISICIFPLGYLVDHEKYLKNGDDSLTTTAAATTTPAATTYSYKRTGITSEALLAYCLILMLVVCALETLFLNTKTDRVEFALYTGELKKAKQRIKDKAASHKKKTGLHKSETWRKVADSASRETRKDHVRSMGATDPLRYTGPIGVALRHKMRLLWGQDSSPDHKVASEQFYACVLQLLHEHHLDDDMEEEVEEGDLQTTPVSSKYEVVQQTAV